MDPRGTTPHATPIVSPDAIRWRDWPLDRRDAGVLVVAYLLATVLLTTIGLAIVRWWDGSSAGSAEADLNRSLEDARTPGLTQIAEGVSNASDTFTKIVLGLVLLPVMLWMFRRWNEYLLIVGGLVLEVCTFGTASVLVGRDRPPVEQLDGAPTNSFPSGHIAASTVFYAGLALVMVLHDRRRATRVVAAVIGLGMPLAMTWARMFQGMHYLSDAVAGICLGAFSLAVMHRLVLPGHEPAPSTRDAAHARSRRSEALAWGWAPAAGTRSRNGSDDRD